MKCPICSWSSEDNEYLLVSETTNWRVCLAPNQSLIGRCVVSTRRHVGDLAFLTRDEIIEFFHIIGALEEALRRAFGATMFNWSCYMNNAHQETPPNPHVHWWAVPRYDHVIKYNGYLFDDLHFGNPYDHSRWFTLPVDERCKIAERVRLKLPAE